MQLGKVIPWGRSMREYELMFALRPEELRLRILGCGDGPASFNAEMAALGNSVISCDPIYAFSPKEIGDQFRGGIEPIMSQVRAQSENYVWSFHKSAEGLLQTRERVMQDFLADYPTGRVQGRYLVGELPTLPFKTGKFDLALCSHFLFLYSRLLSLDFHRSSIRELCRVSREVRIFPLTTLECEISPYIPLLLEELPQDGLRTEVVTVPYQLQRNGNQMLRVHAA